MKHSYSKRPDTFRGFGIVIAAILAGYTGLIGILGVGIKHALDVHAPVAVASVLDSAAHGPVSAPAIIRTSVTE